MAGTGHGWIQDSMNETTDAAAILAPLWKRKWLIMLVGVLVAGASYVYYKRQPEVWSATTQLDLGIGSEVQQLLNSGQNKAALTSRSLADAASLITSGIVAEAAQARLRKEGVHAKVHGTVRAKTVTGSDFIAISAEAGSAKAAARLANAYALAYIGRQHVNYQQQVRSAIADAKTQLSRIEASQAPSSTTTPTTKGKTGPAKGPAQPSSGGSAVIQSASLVSKISQLQASLGLATVQQVSVAKPKSAQLLEPTPKKNAIFGFVLGVLLASLAAFLLGRLERRLRTLSEAEDIFNAPVLSALPSVRQPVIHRDGLVRPAEPLVEPLRRLHTALQMGGVLEREGEIAPRVILFLSADAADGRSSLIADLALIQRDAGANVAVIEADLRQPVLAKLLCADSPRGLAEVLAGTCMLSEAMQRVDAEGHAAEVSGDEAAGGVSTLVQAEHEGSLSVLTAGGPAANPPALLASPAMEDVLRAAASDYDYVLIDAPPPLQVSDVMPLLRAVDAIVIVARIEHTRETSAARLAQLLARTSTAPVMGVAANAVPASDMKKYGFSAVSGASRRPRSLIRR